MLSAVCYLLFVVSYRLSAVMYQRDGNRSYYLLPFGEQTIRDCHVAAPRRRRSMTAEDGSSRCIACCLLSAVCCLW
jgi:hypothetical protein